MSASTLGSIYHFLRGTGALISMWDSVTPTNFGVVPGSIIQRNTNDVRYCTRASRKKSRRSNQILQMYFNGGASNPNLGLSHPHMNKGR